MKNYLKDKNALSVSWLESPFSNQLILYDENLTMVEKSLCYEYAHNGYVIVNLGLSDEFINSIKNDVDSELEKNVKLQEKGYHYTDNPRVFEGWKFSDNIKQLALNSEILYLLKLFYNRKPFPFQTINFTHGSNQPLHSDAIHFHTIPERWVAGVWVALEDMDMDNGTLTIVPKSHKLPFYDLQYLNLNIPEYGNQFKEYSEYENFIDNLVKYNYLDKQPVIIPKGTAIIWASNLLHGGSEIKDLNRTRYSQATHYYFEGCKHYYCPMFSDINEGIISEKNLDNKSIK